MLTYDEGGAKASMSRVTNGRNISEFHRASSADVRVRVKLFPQSSDENNDHD